MEWVILAVEVLIAVAEILSPPACAGQREFPFAALAGRNVEVVMMAG